MGNTAVPPALMARSTAVSLMNLSGCWERLNRSTATPCFLNHSMSAAKRASAMSGSVPQTPVEQHMGGSKTLTVDIGISSEVMSVQRALQEWREFLRSFRHP